MNRRAGVFLLLTVAVFFFAWYLSSLLRLLGLKELILSSTKDLNSCRFYGSMRLDGRTPSWNWSVSYRFEAALDLRNKRIWVKTTGRRSWQENEEEAELYLFENLMCFGNARRGWVKKRLFAPFKEVWSAHDPLQLQLKALEECEILGTGEGTVDGFECRWVEIKPPKPSKILGKGAKYVGENAMPERSVMRYWIQKGTNLLRKVEVEMSGREEGLDYSFSSEIRVFDHNKPVQIELPKEAENLEVFGDLEWFIKRYLKEEFWPENWEPLPRELWGEGFTKYFGGKTVNALVWKVENRLPKPVWITAELDSGEIPDDVLGYFLRIDGFDLGLDWKEFASTFVKDLPSWEQWIYRSREFSTLTIGPPRVTKNWLIEFHQGGVEYTYWVHEWVLLGGPDSCSIFNGKFYENIWYENSFMILKLVIDLRG